MKTPIEEANALHQAARDYEQTQAPKELWKLAELVESLARSHAALVTKVATLEARANLAGPRKDPDRND
jgi:hypothetical protein